MSLENSAQNVQSFWKSIDILITKPHVINKRLWGYKKLFQCKCKPLSEQWDEKLTCFRISDVKSDTALQEEIKKLPVEVVETESVPLEMIIVELLPKVFNEKHAYQLIIIKRNENKVTFYNVTPANYNQNLCPNFSYSFHISKNTINLNVHSDTGSKSVIWLQKTVLPQVIKWANDEQNNTIQMCSESLNLVPKDKYYEKYNKLKLRYGVEMVKIWPESTDPLKFVYEDVAIATYLLLLWESEDNIGKPQKFIDIGCGNGLLVYILTMEGYSGYGVDVRKRKIWDMYPENINLREHTVDPSDLAVFSSADFIIGNHSDELTPWIPVIAAKSSYKCNFFLLPCCAFNFDGTKYQRKNTSLSQYHDYLFYISKVCEKLGFQVKMDRLKLPSTKRICFVSRGRSYSDYQYFKQLDILPVFISQELGNNDNSETGDVKIKLREPTEKVRNCTQLDKNVVNIIISKITNYLVNDIIEKSEWSVGRTVKLSELIKLLSADLLKILKSECGGLQTLLKNHNHIFELKNGYVKLRYPRTIEEVKSKVKKNKLNGVKMQVNKCWFYNHHPQGCPLLSDVCSYLHKKT